MAALTSALLWVSAIGCGLIAGLYFVFSTTIMRALGSIEPQVGMAAMVSINQTILRGAFLPLFSAPALHPSSCWRFRCWIYRGRMPC